MARAPTVGRSPGRRDQLVAAAAELFVVRGYGAVPVEEVAAVAGVSGPSVYRHFADKQALLTEVVLGGVADLEQLSADALDGGAASDRPGTRVDALLMDLVAMAVRRPAAAVLWRWTGGHLDEIARREVAHRAHRLLSGWVDVLRTDRVELTEDGAELLWWGVLSVLASAVNHSGRPGPRRTRTLLFDAARRLLDVRPEPPLPARATPAPVLPGGRREQIVQAASVLFAERGFPAVGIDHIGSAIGIAGPSVYRHFPSKISILVAVCQRAADRLVLGAAEARRTSAGGGSTMRALVASYVDVLFASTDLRVGMSTDRSLITGAERDVLLRRQRDYVALWVHALTAARPGLSVGDATVLVHAGLTVANDLARTGAVAGRGGLAGELVTLVLAVLDVPEFDGEQVPARP